MMPTSNKKYASTAETTAAAFAFVVTILIVAYGSLGINDGNYSLGQFWDFLLTVGMYSFGPTAVIWLIIAFTAKSESAIDSACDFLIKPACLVIAIGIVPYIFGLGFIFRFPFLKGTGALMVWSFFFAAYSIVFDRITKAVLFRSPRSPSLEQREFTLAWRLGVRASAAIYSCADKFKSEVKISYAGKEASAKRVMDILLLGTPEENLPAGTRIKVVTSGTDASAAMKALEFVFKDLCVGPK